jgi:hypothetical protein
MANAVGTIIVTAVLLMVGVILVGNFQQSADTQITALNNSEASTAFTSVTTSIWGSFNLMGMLPYIIGAVAILGYVYMLGGRD